MSAENFSVAANPLRRGINHQRKGAMSNVGSGRDFELLALDFFMQAGFPLKLRHELAIGYGEIRKNHKFDLGCDTLKVIVECVSHRWPVGRVSPTAKMSVWTESMYFFTLAPEGYRKVLFVLRDKCERRGITLGKYYFKKYGHLIPPDVELLEFDEVSREATLLNSSRAK